MAHHEPRHLAPADRRAWRAGVLRTATAAVMAGLISLPAPALGATDIYVGADQYFEAASGQGSEGGTWAWDGADGMALVDYAGGAICANGDLSIGLSGDNHVGGGDANGDGYGEGVRVEGGDPTLTGEGSLTVTGEAYGEGLVAEAITIDGTSVTVEGGRIDAGNGSVSIVNGSRVDVNNSKVDVSSETGGAATGGAAISGYSVTIRDSTVNVATEGSQDNAMHDITAISGWATIDIADSVVSA